MFELTLVGITAHGGRYDDFSSLDIVAVKLCKVAERS